MNLVFLHGPPAAGKHTVGRELAALTGYELYHNHFVVDAVLQRHAFGTPEFVAERDRAWRDHLTAATTRGVAGLIFTFNPENSVPQAFIDWLFDGLPRSGVRVVSVGLILSEAEIERRLGGASRRRFHKLTDLGLYRRLRAEGAFDTPVIPRTDLSIDTSILTAPESARRVMALFWLG